MKPEVAKALEQGIEQRREILGGLDYETRLSLLEELLMDFFVRQAQILVKWASLTGQSAQVDSGYAAQHVASILLGEPGQGFRGKGLDLANGGEVKSAAVISGVDRPRWNHSLGSVSDDAKRTASGKQTKTSQYLSAPCVFYLLLDTVFDNAAATGVMRIRGWLVDSANDTAWRDLFERFDEEKHGSTYNLQLHPPVGYDDDLVINMLGNLDFADAKVFEVRLDTSDTEPSPIWVLKPPPSLSPWMGRTVAKPYVSRPSRLGGAADVLISLDGIADLLPQQVIQTLEDITETEAAVSD